MGLLQNCYSKPIQLFFPKKKKKINDKITPAMLNILCDVAWTLPYIIHLCEVRVHKLAHGITYFMGENMRQYSSDVNLLKVLIYG